jgi:hypothetical protein
LAEVGGETQLLSSSLGQVAFVTTSSTFVSVEGSTFMQKALSLLQMLVMGYLALILAFVTLLAMPHGKLRRLLMPLIGLGLAFVAAIYCLDPADVMPQSFIDDFGAITGGLAAAVAAIQASRPDEQEPQ